MPRSLRAWCFPLPLTSDAKFEERDGASCDDGDYNGALKSKSSMAGDEGVSGSSALARPVRPKWVLREAAITTARGVWKKWQQGSTVVLSKRLVDRIELYGEVEVVGDRVDDIYDWRF